VAVFAITYYEYLRELLPEFEAQTGIKAVMDIQAFPIYNQRADLELSTRDSALDVVNVTFIYSGRWIRAGWLTDLTQFLNDANATPADWDPGDFVAGAQVSLRDAKGGVYGFGAEAGTMVLGAARADLIEKAGLKLPTTMDDMVAVCDAVHGKQAVAAFTADNLHHAAWPPYHQAQGGTIFRHVPDDLTPTLDTPVAARTAGWYAHLLAKYGPPGILSFTDDQALETQLSGRCNIRTTVIDLLLPLAKNPASTVKDTVQFGMMPGGPAGNFPGVNCHGLGIPAGSRKKEAAWEFVKWALSKQMVRRMAVEKGYPSVCRRSVIEDPTFKANMMVNGQDLAALYLKVLQMPAQSNYTAYRTMPVFPQVGDKINRAISAIASGQMDPPSAMKQAQAQAVADIVKAGYKINL
jgi:multiple sugar transport system substrate-binding protein